MIRCVFYFEDDSVTIHHENTRVVTTEFLNGYYNVKLDKNNRLLINMVEFNEVHTPYPNQKYSEVIDSVTKFLDPVNYKRCTDMGYIYKLNTLLYGPPGSGKTSLINFISNTLIEKHNAIVFRIDDIYNVDCTWSLAENIRKIQDNPIIFIVDEFEQYCAKNFEAVMKTLLDGDRSINNSMVFAATNYLDRIPDSIKSRPSRFRIVSEIEPISSEEVIIDLITKQSSKVKGFLDKDEILKIAKDLQKQGCTVDAIKNVILDKLMDLSLDLPERKIIGFNKEVEEDSKNSEMFDDLIQAFKFERINFTSDETEEDIPKYDTNN